MDAKKSNTVTVTATDEDLKPKKSVKIEISAASTS